MFTMLSPSSLHCLASPQLSKNKKLLTLQTSLHPSTADLLQDVCITSAGLL